MEPALSRSAPPTWLLAALVVSVSGGCAGEPFTSLPNTGSGGAPATGGAALGGSASAGTLGQAGRGGSGGTAGKSGVTGGAAPTGGSSAGGVAANGGVVAVEGGAAPQPEIPRNGLVLWLAADRGVMQTNGAVSKWLDQSGQRADASQIASDARPKFVEAGQNGLPLLDFDGTNDSLALPEGFADFSKGVHFFSVVHLLRASYCQSVLQLSNGPEIEDIDFGRFMGSVHYEVGSLYVTGQPDAFEINETTLLDYAHHADGGAELRMDGQFMKSGSLPLPNVIPRVANSVGHSLYPECQFLKARVGEIVLYARALASEERGQVEAYLLKKWGCCAL